MTMKQPPEFLGMQWRDDGNRGFAAVMNSDFWILYNAERDELRAAGISCGNDDNFWHVYYNPKKDHVGAETLLPQLELAYASKIAEAHEIAAAKEREAEIAAENARQERAEWLEANADLVERTITKAKSLQAAYGDALHDKDLIARMLAHRPGPLLISDLQKAIDAAERKIERTGAKVVPTRAKTTVTWTDDVVVKAVNIMTGLDDDHAEDPNKVGWNAGHSPIGHWCHGALQDPRYREKALMLARSILGGYVKQLSQYMPVADLAA